MAEDLLHRLAKSPLTPNLLEDLRMTMTGLALRGELSQARAGDETVADTVALYQPSSRRAEPPLARPPFQIPEHWKWVQFNRISDFTIGRTPSTRDAKFWADDRMDGVPWVAISDMPRRGMVTTTGRSITAAGVADSFSGQKRVAIGTLLMSFKLSLGKTAISGIECYHNEAIASLSVQDEILKSFLLWALPHLAQYAGSNPAVRGSTLNSRSINAMWIPIPPRSEQERIVASLRWAVDVIEELAYRSEAARDASSDLMKVLLTRTSV